MPAMEKYLDKGGLNKAARMLFVHQGNQLGSGVDPELGVNLFQMIFYGMGTQMNFLGDFLVAQSLGDQVEYLGFPFSEVVFLREGIFKTRSRFF